MSATEFGESIRRGREEAGLSQARLAGLIGKSPSTIRAWEQGRSRPADRAAVSALAAVLGLDESATLEHAGFAAPAEVEERPTIEQELATLAPTVLPPERRRTLFDDLSAFEEPPAAGSPVIVEEDEAPGEAGEPVPAETPEEDSPVMVEPVSVEPVSVEEAAALPANGRKVTAIPPPMPAVPVVVQSLSYIEDSRERDFYRRRAIITAVVGVAIVVVLWWALNRTGSALVEFFRSIVDSLNL
jgi:transcriptional regulator with XRE-family HTH domain